jgi:hypothetical protein
MNCKNTSIVIVLVFYISGTEIIVFQDLSACRLAEGYRRFGGNFCRDIQAVYRKQVALTYEYSLT